MQASAAARREWTVGHDPYRREMDRGTRSLPGNVGVVASSGPLGKQRVWKIGMREAKPPFSGCFTGFNDRLDPNFTALYSVFHG